MSSPVDEICADFLEARTRAAAIAHACDYIENLYSTNKTQDIVAFVQELWSRPGYSLLFLNEIIIAYKELEVDVPADSALLRLQHVFYILTCAISSPVVASDILGCYFLLYTFPILRKQALSQDLAISILNTIAALTAASFEDKNLTALAISNHLCAIETIPVLLPFLANLVKHSFQLAAKILHFIVRTQVANQSSALTSRNYLSLVQFIKMVLLQALPCLSESKSKALTASITTLLDTVVLVEQKYAASEEVCSVAAELKRAFEAIPCYAAKAGELSGKPTL